MRDCAERRKSEGPTDIQTCMLPWSCRCKPWADFAVTGSQQAEEVPSPGWSVNRKFGVNITIGWDADGWAGRATLHDTDATQTHTGAHESHARHTSQRSAKLKHLRTERVASPSIAAREQQPGMRAPAVETA